jgi:predicted DNA-binding transcriptional regulator YafY
LGKVKAKQEPHMADEREISYRYTVYDRCLSSTLQRYWTLRELQVKLAQEDIDVSLRTVYRDLVNMEECDRLGYFAPIDYCDTNKGYYYIDPAYRIQVKVKAPEIQELKLIREKASELHKLVEGVLMKFEMR